jgi:hypothetical protein
MVKKYGFKFEGGKLVEPGSTAPAVNAASGDSKSKKGTEAAGKKRKAADSKRNLMLEAQMMTAMSKNKLDTTGPKLMISWTCRAEDERVKWEFQVEILLHPQYNDLHTQSTGGRAIFEIDKLVGRNWVLYESRSMVKAPHVRPCKAASSLLARLPSSLSIKIPSRVPAHYFHASFIPPTTAHSLPNPENTT